MPPKNSGNNGKNRKVSKKSDRREKKKKREARAKLREQITASKQRLADAKESGNEASYNALEKEIKDLNEDILMMDGDTDNDEDEHEDDDDDDHEDDRMEDVGGPVIKSEPTDESPADKLDSMVSAKNDQQSSTKGFEVDDRILIDNSIDDLPIPPGAHDSDTWKGVAAYMRTSGRTPKDLVEKIKESGKVMYRITDGTIPKDIPDITDAAKAPRRIRQAGKDMKRALTFPRSIRGAIVNHKYTKEEQLIPMNPEAPRDQWKYAYQEELNPAHYQDGGELRGMPKPETYAVFKWVDGVDGVETRSDLRALGTKKQFQLLEKQIYTAIRFNEIPIMQANLDKPEWATLKKEIEGGLALPIRPRKQRAHKMKLRSDGPVPAAESSPVPSVERSHGSSLRATASISPERSQSARSEGLPVTASPQPENPAADQTKNLDPKQSEVLQTRTPTPTPAPGLGRSEVVQTMTPSPTPERGGLWEEHMESVVFQSFVDDFCRGKKLQVKDLGKVDKKGLLIIFEKQEV